MTGAAAKTARTSAWVNYPCHLIKYDAVRNIFKLKKLAGDPDSLYHSIAFTWLMRKSCKDSTPCVVV